MSARAASLVVTAAVAVLASCDTGSGPPPPQASNVRVLHTIRGGPSLTVSVDGGRGSTLLFGDLSRSFPLSPGQHELDIVPADTTHTFPALFSTAEGVNYGVFLIDSMSSGNVIVEPVLVPDTGAVPAAGHGRLRLVNFAAAAPPIDAYRTQPDGSGLILTRQPLNFRAITGYFESTPGKWTIVIAHSGVMDTLLVTDSIAVGDGQARTVAIIDSAGSLVSWRVVPDRN